MGVLITAIIAIAGLALGWATIEIACKPCLEKGREAIDRNLDPNYDPDDDHQTTAREPLNPTHAGVSDDVASSSPVKSI